MIHSFEPTSSSTGWLLPLPYTVLCFIGLILPFQQFPKFDEVDQRELKKREVDNLYICIVTRGSNKEVRNNRLRMNILTSSS